MFRTNASYKRWDEARKNWGLNINHTRNLVRMATAWSSAEYEPDEEIRKESLRRLARAVWSFVRSLKRHLSNPDEDEEPFRAELYEKLPTEMADAIIAAVHRPNRAMFEISCAVNDLPMHFMRRNEIDKDVIIFEDTCGGSERLFSSPVPIFYTRHTARFLSAWLLLLPLALYEPFKGTWNHIGMVPAATIISIFLFGIEELAVQLEEPFSILPMQGFCDKICANLDEIVEWHEEPEPEVPNEHKQVAGAPAISSQSELADEIVEWHEEPEPEVPNGHKQVAGAPAISFKSELAPAIASQSELAPEITFW